MPTTRFKELIAHCGRPEIHLSWSVPTKDRVLQRAVMDNRLLTVHQQGRGAKKDFATVGLHPGKFVQYLVFPRSLRAFADRKVVGIDYDSLGRQLSVSVPEEVDPRVKSAPVSRPAKKGRRDGIKIAPFAEPDSPRPERADWTIEKPASVKTPVAVRPWNEEVRAAVTDLKAGRRQPALARLQALLAREES
jgi:hypothetical protein